MCYVYVLQSESTKKLYIGCTKDLETRLKRHNNELPHNQKSFTYKQKGPWVVVYKEKCEDRDMANKREKYLKSGVGREFIHKQIMRP